MTELSQALKRIETDLFGFLTDAADDAIANLIATDQLFHEYVNSAQPGEKNPDEIFDLFQEYHCGMNGTDLGAFLDVITDSIGPFVYQGITIEFEGGGQRASELPIEDVYSLKNGDELILMFRVTGHYDSYEGAYFENDSVEIVKPYRTIVTVYETDEEHGQDPSISYLNDIEME